MTRQDIQARFGWTDAEFAAALLCGFPAGYQCSRSSSSGWRRSQVWTEYHESDVDAWAERFHLLVVADARARATHV